MKNVRLFLIAISLLFEPFVMWGFTQTHGRVHDKSLTDRGEASAESDTSLGKVEVDSIPTGANIEMDGAAAGVAPSEVQVTEGAHKLLLKKEGFKDWECTLTIKADSRLYIKGVLESVSRNKQN